MIVTSAAAGSRRDSFDEEEEDNGGVVEGKQNVFLKHCDQCPYDEALEALSPLQRFRMKVHYTMENPAYSVLARTVSVTIMVLIFVSTIAFCLETVPELENTDFWKWLETGVVIIFSLEYVLRLANSRHVLRFMSTFLNVIDLFAILPFYIDLLGNSSETRTLRVFRVIRLARVFRLFKMSRYSSYMQIMGYALKRSTDAFGLLLFFIGIAVIIFSSLMYYAERGDEEVYLEQQSDGSFQNSTRYVRSDGLPTPFFSIPATFYWCIVTMTTVGYGDVTPITTAGKLIAAMTMICGILVIALPITILGSNFQDVYSIHKKSRTKKQTMTANGMRLKQHIQAIRAHRVELDKTMKQLRYLLQKRSGNTDFFQIWTTVDYVVLVGLKRVEQFLTRLETQDKRLLGVGAAAADEPTPVAEGKSAAS